MRLVRKLTATVLCLCLTQCLGAPEAPPTLAGGKDDADVSGPADRGTLGDGATHDLGQLRDGSLRDQGGRQDARPATDGSSSDAHLDGLISIDARVSPDARPVDGTVPDGRIVPDAGRADASPDALQPDAAGGRICVPDTVEPCGSNTGECAFGERICTAAGIWGACEGGVGPTDEICNGADDDCDGATDENLTQPCGVGAGPCEFGIQRCIGGEWGVCDDSAGPQPEVCDGIDNDCDGATDEDYQPVMECGVGACALDAVPSVCEGGVVVPCQPGPPAPDDTTCDGVDDDCDGAIDEDYVVIAVCGVGACRARSVASNCVAGRETVCAPGVRLAPDDATCDGVDDDCDGAVDEDYVTVPACGVGACRASSVPSVCAGGVESPCQPGVAAAADSTCDGVDDDCNGAVDEDYAVLASCGQGVCRAGATASSCTNGIERSCTPGAPRGASDATCDGLDDDCDGQVDEDYRPVPRCGIGACAAASGPSTCVGGQETPCQPGQPAASDATCDGVDDDCDGQTDENYHVVANCGVGECRTGATPSSCMAGRETICAPAPAQAETCDGLDNDCDGAVDDGNPGGNLACDSGQLGVCAAGMSVCAQGRVRCDADVAAADETCDGLDNDCDGLVDEVAGGEPLTRACYDGAAGTSGVGICHSGTQTCGAGQYGACVGEVTPGIEICDGLDNNCDGTVDDSIAGHTVGQACDGVGACGAGVHECNGANATRCSTGPGGSASQVRAETCNGADDDCDGQTDEGVANCCDGGGAPPCNGCPAGTSVPAGWVCAPVGDFTMGSPAGPNPPAEPHRGGDEVQHQVVLTRPFLLKATEVTQREWFDVMGSRPWRSVNCGETCPVEGVYWYEAIAYCNALSSAQGLPSCYADSGGSDYDANDAASEVTPVWRNQSACTGYRLPTEAEWEYAARAGTLEASYNGPVNASDCALDDNVSPIGWYCGNSGSALKGVSLKRANPWGIHDVLGNVWEWVWDRYGVYPQGAIQDPSGPALGPARVVRGGSFDGAAAYMRSAVRAQFNPVVARDNSYIGFRPARTIVLGDTDSDGLPDDVELACGMNPNLIDAAGDYDHDATANGSECLAGTNLLPVLFLTTFNTGVANQYGVVVNLRQPTAALRPQAAEVFIDYDATKLSFNAGASARGAAAEAAGKLFSTDGGDADTIRFTLISVNNIAIRTGDLAQLVFDRVAAGPANLTFVTEGQDATELGPQAALSVLTFGVGNPVEPLTIQVQ